MGKNINFILVISVGLMLCSHLVAEQSGQDYDYDGLIGEGDPAEYVSDIPVVLISGETVELGLAYLVSGSAQTTERRSVSIESTDTFSTTEKELASVNDTVESSFSRTIAANLGSGLETVWGLNANISGNYQRASSFSYEHSFSSEAISKYSESTKQFGEWVRNAKVEFKSNSGFIRSGLRIRNRGSSPVTISNLSARFVEKSVWSGENVRTIALVDLPDVEVHPSNTDFPYFSVPVRLADLATNEIINIQQRGNRIALELQHYELSYNGRSFSPSMISRQLKRGTIKINVLDQFGFYESFYVSTKASGGPGLSLSDALTHISNGKLSIERNAAGSAYIAAFNGERSGFKEWGDAAHYTADDLRKGAWVAAIHDLNQNRIDITQDVRPGSEFTVAYISKEHVWSKIRIDRDLGDLAFGDTDILNKKYYWDFKYPPLTKSDAKTNRAHDDWFQRISNRHRPERIERSEGFHIRRGDRIVLELTMYHSPLKFVNQSVRYAPSCKGNCTGMWREEGNLRRILFDFKPLDIDDLKKTGLEIWFQSEKHRESLSSILLLSSYKKLDQYADGSVRIEFEPPASFLNEEGDTSFGFWVQPDIQRVEFGLETTRVSSHGTDPAFRYREESVRIPKHGELSIKVSQAPRLVSSQ